MKMKKKKYQRIRQKVNIKKDSRKLLEGINASD